MKRLPVPVTAVWVAAFALAESCVVVNAVGAPAAEKGTPDNRPNIVFLMTDDQRWDTLGCYGRTDVITPNIDRLAEQGVAFDNAFYAVNEKRLATDGKYEPEVTVTTTKAEDQVGIRIADNGIGIPDEIKDRIFEPFFTTKPTGSGTGLGLSLSHDIVVKGHGGLLTVESEEGEGATFVITLPVL